MTDDTLREVLVAPYGDAASIVAVPSRHVPEAMLALAPYGEVVPGIETVTVLHAVGARPPARLPLGERAGPGRTARVHEIEVAYDGADLDAVAEATGCAASEVVRLHSGARYRVAMIGFAPGFPYLSGLDARLHLGRRVTPRPSVPAGSVAIAGRWTGIYPSRAPGGWHLLGRTAQPLFDAGAPAGVAPALLRAGDAVRFRPVDPARVPELSPRPHAHPWTAGPVVVRSAGLLTVQDLGREGAAQSGVGASGAADAVALRLANRLVGNDDRTAALEAAVIGPTLHFLEDATVAVTGARGDVRPDCSIAVRAGETVALGALRDGLRCYVGIAGGVRAPLVLGSCATDTLSGLGPPPLRTGDRIPLGAPGPPASARAVARFVRGTPARSVPPGVIRVTAGPHGDGHDLEGKTFTVAGQSNRVGLRLDGDRLPTRSAALPSLAMVTGAVQVPPDGQPIVLLADHGTTGGYPVVAVVISADIPAVAQLGPGARVGFTVVSREAAEAAWHEQQRWLRTAVAHLDRL